MKKATLENILTILETRVGLCDEFVQEVTEEVRTELNKGAEKAQANRDLYASAHDVVIDALASAAAPVTMSELWTAVEKNVPDGITKGKMQYAVTRLWTDEIVKTEGKVNTYSLKA